MVHAVGVSSARTFGLGLVVAIGLVLRLVPADSGSMEIFRGFDAFHEVDDFGEGALEWVHVDLVHLFLPTPWRSKEKDVEDLII